MIFVIVALLLAFLSWRYTPTQRLNIGIGLIGAALIFALLAPVVYGEEAVHMKDHPEQVDR